MEGILRARRTAYDSVMSERPGHAMELAEDAVKAGRDLICSVGGDGTLNEVGNGILRGAAGGEVPCLGIIPGGRGSDFHRALGIPRDSDGSLRIALEGTPRLIDAGLMHFILDGRQEQRYFFNICGTGFDAEVTARANRMPGFMGGTVPYLLSTLVSLFTLKPKHVRMTVDGVEKDPGEIAGVVIANGRYYGGGMMISPHSEMDDGLFHIIIMKKKTPPQAGHEALEHLQRHPPGLAGVRGVDRPGAFHRVARTHAAAAGWRGFRRGAFQFHKH